VKKRDMPFGNSKRAAKKSHKISEEVAPRAGPSHSGKMKDESSTIQVSRELNLSLVMMKSKHSQEERRFDQTLLLL